MNDDILTLTNYYNSEYTELCKRCKTMLRAMLSAVPGLSVKIPDTFLEGRHYDPSYGITLEIFYKGTPCTLRFTHGFIPDAIHFEGIEAGGRYWRFRAHMRPWPERPTMDLLVTELEKLHKRYTSKLAKSQVKAPTPLV